MVDMPYNSTKQQKKKNFITNKNLMSGGESPVVELWCVESISSLPLLPDPLWPGVTVQGTMCGLK